MVSTTAWYLPTLLLYLTTTTLELTIKIASCSDLHLHTGYSCAKRVMVKEKRIEHKNAGVSQANTKTTDTSIARINKYHVYTTNRETNTTLSRVLL